MAGAHRIMPRIAGFAMLLLAGPLGPGVPANALVTDWVVDHNPVYYGDMLIVGARDDGQHGIASYWWGRKYPNDAAYHFFGSDGGWIAFQGGVGTVYVRLIVTYAMDDDGNVHPPTTIDHSITVLPPDGCRVALGPGVDTPVGTDVEVVFVPTCDGRDVGEAGSLLYAQEYITNFESQVAADGSKIPTPPEIWVPDPTTGGDRYYTIGNTIYDLKLLNAGTIFRSQPDGRWIFRYRQFVGMQVPAMDGINHQWVSFGPFDFAHVRVNVNTWRLDN